MDRQEFSDLVGGELRHVTLRTNLPGIRQNGLLRASTLIEKATDLNSLPCPRSEAFTFKVAGTPATLNHQKPLLAGRAQVTDFLNGHCLETWSQKLDQRLFFWPSDRGSDFASSLTDRGQISILKCGAGALFDLYAPWLDLAPINTGSATRRPARRGDWIYVPVSASVNQFRENRLVKKLVTGRDSVIEVSLRCDIPPDEFHHLFSIFD